MLYDVVLAKSVSHHVIRLLVFCICLNDRQIDNGLREFNLLQVLLLPLLLIPSCSIPDLGFIDIMSKCSNVYLLIYHCLRRVTSSNISLDVFCFYCEFRKNVVLPLSAAKRCRVSCFNAVQCNNCLVLLLCTAASQWLSSGCILKVNTCSEALVMMWL